MRSVKVAFDRPSRKQYLKEILLSIFSFSFFHHLMSLLAYYIINNVIGRKKAVIGEGSKVHPTVIIRQGERVSIGKGCLINHNNVLQAGKKVGRIVIGNYVQTGPNVMMFAFNHGIENNGIPMILQDYMDGDIVIEDDVWIGAGTTITAGVTIGTGCVIGAGSVVTKDLPPMSVCAGSPAKVIRER